MKDLTVIGFDADDTLWVNEPYYQETEKEFCKLLSPYGSSEEISKELYKTEMQNLSLYGYGAKGFILSMTETALRISANKIDQQKIDYLLKLGKNLIDRPIVLLDNVKHVLNELQLKGKTLIIATKGDLLDQERKLDRSSLRKFFHHIEIMTDKKESDYKKLTKQLKIFPENFLMVGNSLKSDILPVLNMGGNVVHIPYNTTWMHEEVNYKELPEKYVKLNSISELLKLPV